MKKQGNRMYRNDFTYNTTPSYNVNTLLNFFNKTKNYIQQVVLEVN